jgi:hypothetical protein
MEMLSWINDCWLVPAQRRTFRILHAFMETAFPFFSSLSMKLQDVARSLDSGPRSGNSFESKTIQGLFPHERKDNAPQSIVGRIMGCCRREN